MVFNGCGYKPTKNTNIKEVSVRVINVYFRQNPDQVYLAMITVKDEKASFTVS
jgi:hypothetical protein